MDMHLKDSWENESFLINYLAMQLVNGRLGLFLGAGISSFYGLPDWNKLILELCKKQGEDYDKDKDDAVQKAGYIRRTYYKNNADGFKTDVSNALYDGKNLDHKLLRSSPMLAAIGSLVMSSKRGSASQVFSLNFDDLLESYLEFHGFTTSIVSSEKHWAENQDVTVYHPHGFLPLDKSRKPSGDIVLGTNEFLKVMDSDLWQPLLQTAHRTHTFLYLGLSGGDPHLQKILSNISDKHAISEERIAYHTVRFKLKGDKDEVGTILEELNVFTHELDNYDALPDLLFRICQRAREIRTSNR